MTCTQKELRRENYPKALIYRIVGDHADSFVAEVLPDEGKDIFEIASRNGKVILRGNNDVSILPLFITT